MKLLLLTDRYWPAPEANELCAINIIEYINPDFITIACNVSDIRQEGVICKGTQKIICVHVTEEKNFYDRNILRKLAYLAKHFIGCFMGNLPNSNICRKLEKIALDEVAKNQYDLIIATLNPVEAVEVGARIKSANPSIKFIIYDVDSASNCSIGKIESIFSNFYKKKVFKWENRVFSFADVIVHFDSHRVHFSQEKYKKFLSKTLFQGVPLLNIEDSNKNVYSTHVERKKIVYAGAFYRRLREPDILLRIIREAVKIDKDIFLDIYTRNQAVEQLKPFETKNVKIHGYIAQKDLNVITNTCGALVSIGNKTTDMFPSKVVSYIASLKPIIHIYQNNADPVIEFLKEYPSVLLLDATQNPSKNAEDMIKFLTRDCTNISLQDILELYEKNTPSYCAEEIKNYLINQP